MLGRIPLRNSMLKLVTPADVMTLVNATLGVFAILFLFTNHVRVSFSLILLAVLADGVDGMIARRIGIGKLGQYLESMADMISLAVAPVLFVYGVYLQQISSSVLVQIV